VALHEPIRLLARDAVARELCEKLLANPVIEQYEILV